MSTLDVKISSMYPPGQQGGIRAYASATIDGCFAVRGIKVVEGGRDVCIHAQPEDGGRLQGSVLPCDRRIP